MLPPPPRPLTPRVRRRAWGDIHVRFWWLSALAIGLVICWFAVGQVRAGLRDREIINNGIPLKAMIKTAADKRIKGQSQMRDVPTPVTLTATMPDGSEREFAGTLPQGPGFLTVGDTIEIRVARDDPRDWTHQTTPAPWTQELTLPLMFVPIIAALLVVAVLVRRRVLRVWRDGVTAEGIVSAVRHSAWAPRSRLVRYSLTGTQDRRIFSLLCPPGRRVPAVGESIQLVMLPQAPKYSLWATAYAPEASEAAS